MYFPSFFQVLCLIGRALNIYPLSYVVNHFREHKITKKMMFIMWFSGMSDVFHVLECHYNVFTFPLISGQVNCTI